MIQYRIQSTAASNQFSIFSPSIRSKCWVFRVTKVKLRLRATLAIRRSSGEIGRPRRSSLASRSPAARAAFVSNSRTCTRARISVAIRLQMLCESVKRAAPKRSSHTVTTLTKSSNRASRMKRSRTPECGRRLSGSLTIFVSSRNTHPGYLKSGESRRRCPWREASISSNAWK